jgi:periplasmic protein CpxP/Spy
MDLIKQNKFLSLIIVILVVLNVLTLSIIWMQSGYKNQPPSESGKQPPSSISLMQKQIGLNEEQTKNFEEMQKDLREQTRKVNDELDSLKLLLAEEIFDPLTSENRADSLASKIGIYQSKLEFMRYKHFRALVKICTEEQRDKLRPVLKEFYSKKSPGEKQIPPKEVIKKNEDKAPGEKKEEKPALPPGDKPNNEEKIKRYIEKLSLSDEQIEKVKNIMNESIKKREVLKSKIYNNPAEAEFERKRIGKDEDENIILILNEDQRKEFEKMRRNRENR